MSTSAARAVRIDPDPAAVEVEVSDTVLRIVLTDGRELSAPLAWFPRLRDATPEQRRRWELVGRGHGIHWPDVDEDVSVRVLLGQPS
jgi:hypothetical protein